MLAISLREKILDRLGLSSLPEISEDGLAEVYTAWCKHVPFDNIRKLIHVQSGDSGQLPADTPEDFFEGWLRHHTGGTCWAGNGALQALLSSIGFDAVRGVATMLVVPQLPPNHGTVITRFDSREFLVDASILHSKPILFAETNLDKQLDFGQRLVRNNDKWAVHWAPANHPEGMDCRIEYWPTDSEDFAKRHEHTRGWSPFNYSLAVRTIRGNCMVGSFGLEWYQQARTDGAISKREVTYRERAEMLIAQGYSEEIVSKLPQDKPNSATSRVSDSSARSCHA